MMSLDLHELQITRHIAAPPAVVWHVMVERMAEWWCPRPWRAEPIVQERRPGGRFTMVMHGPEGQVMPIAGIYLAWEEGVGFTTTDAVIFEPDSGFVPAEPFMISSRRLAPDGAGTLYTATARHWTAEARAKLLEMGFEAGWAAAADQLARLCEEGG